MARTAGIVIRVEPETRDKLNQIAQENGVELATELYKVAARIADGELDLIELAGGAAPAGIDINSKINEAIAPALEGIEGELSLLKKRLALIEENHGGKIINVEAIATKTENLGDIPENSPSRLRYNEQNDTVRMNHPEPKPKAIEEPETGEKLTQAELAKLLGVNASSISRAKKDPAKLAALCQKNGQPEYIFDGELFSPKAA